MSKSRVFAVSVALLILANSSIVLSQDMSMFLEPITIPNQGPTMHYYNQADRAFNDVVTGCGKGTWIGGGVTGVLGGIPGGLVGMGVGAAAGVVGACVGDYINRLDTRPR